MAALELSEESARGEAERLLGELAASLEESIAVRAARPAPRRQPAPAAPSAERPAARAAGAEPETPPATARLPVPAAAGAGAAGVLALALAAALGRRGRRRSAWFEIRYRWSRSPGADAQRNGGRRVGDRPLAAQEGGPALLTGRSCFVDDLSARARLRAAILRSPHAHARIVSIDGSAALAEPRGG